MGGGELEVGLKKEEKKAGAGERKTRRIKRGIAQGSLSAHILVRHTACSPAGILVHDMRE